MKAKTKIANLTFAEASSIIIGHGVGSGILAVPYLASRNSLRDLLVVIVLAYAINLLLHLMIADLSLNNHGAQFVKCFENELFTGKLKKVATWAAFGLLGISVLVNVAGFIAGGAAVFESWFGLPSRIGMILYYLLASGVVLYGLKIVGIFETYAVVMMVAVMAVLGFAVVSGTTYPLPTTFVSLTNVLALYSMISFSLSAVMSVPQVVKGLDGDPVKIRWSIAAGTGVNAALILLVTFITLFGAGRDITGSGALVDLSAKLGGWVGSVGYLFSLLALSTSFWANTLNLRDIMTDQTGWSESVSFGAGSLPCLLLALLGLNSFVGFTRLAGVIQVMTGIGVILAFHKSRKRTGQAAVSGKFGVVLFEAVVILSSLVATIGSVLPVK